MWKEIQASRSIPESDNTEHELTHFQCYLD